MLHSVKLPKFKGKGAGGSSWARKIKGRKDSHTRQTERVLITILAVRKQAKAPGAAISNSSMWSVIKNIFENIHNRHKTKKKRNQN